MRIRGEFNISGQLVPNQFTAAGAKKLFEAAFHQSHADWYMGLCADNPMTGEPNLGDLNEPTLGVGSYQRITLPHDNVNWVNVGALNDESYITTREFTFGLTSAIDVAVNRFFLTDGVKVLAISSALYETPIILDSPLIAKYRLYLR